MACPGGQRCRGQAWVTFTDVDAAIRARDSRQGFATTDDKGMRIAFARMLQPIGFQPSKQAPKVEAEVGSKRGRQDDNAADAVLPENENPPKERRL